MIAAWGLVLYLSIRIFLDLYKRIDKRLKKITFIQIIISITLYTLTVFLVYFEGILIENIFRVNRGFDNSISSLFTIVGFVFGYEASLFLTKKFVRESDNRKSLGRVFVDHFFNTLFALFFLVSFVFALFFV